MRIDTVVIHEIIKKEKSTSAGINLSVSAVDSTNERVIKMIEALDNSFSKKTLRRAKFSNDGFKSIVKDFSDFDLLGTSGVLVEKLKDGMQNIPAAKGGYVVFCKYATTKNYLAIFLVRDTNGSLLTFTQSRNWNINSTEYLDVDNFAMGTKINLDILKSGSEDRYVSLVKGNTDISEYFSNWIGLDDTKLESKDADVLYEVANKIDLPEGVSRDELKRKIYDYSKSAVGKIVNIRDLSRYLFDDDSVIQLYCEENGFDLDGEFKLSGQKLNKFFKVSVKAGNIELSAPRSEFSPEGIEIVNGSVIIHSKELAEAISKTLAE